MIAYDSTGSLLVLTDGAELLVHDGPSEGPLWRRTLDAPIAGVGATADHVIAVDRAGRATWSEARRDRVLARVDAGVAVHAAAVSSTGDLLLATDDGARVLTRSGPGLVIAHPHARAVAWSNDGGILVAAADGKVGEYDPRGRLLRTLDLDAPAVAAAWSAKGFWVLATARKLVRLEAGALHHLTGAPDDVPVTAVACSADGTRIALGLGDDLMIVLAWPSRDTVGQLRYIDRKIAGLAFGPTPWLGVGLDLGDGNKLNLTSGALHRTDTHPGRPHNRWMVKVSVHPPDADTAEAPTPTPTPTAAPSTPQHAAYAPPPEATRTRTSPLTLILVTVAVLTALILTLGR